MSGQKRPSIGGSEAAVILGLHPYQQPIELWAHKMVPQINPDPFMGNPATDWGLEVEPALLSSYERRHRCRIVERNVTKNHGWRRATPDGLIEGQDCGVEAKNSSVTATWGEPGTDEIPVEHWIQCQWYMDLLGLERWVVTASVGGRPPADYPIDRDQDTIENIEHECREWYDRHIVERREPEIDSSGAFRQYLYNKHPWARQDYLPATKKANSAAISLQRVRQELSVLQHNHDRLVNELCAEIGEYSGIETELGRITWRPRKGSVSWKNVAADLFFDHRGGTPADLKEFAERHRGHSTRTFRVPSKWSQA